MKIRLEKGLRFEVLLGALHFLQLENFGLVLVNMVQLLAKLLRGLFLQFLGVFEHLLPKVALVLPLAVLEQLDVVCRQIYDGRQVLAHLLRQKRSLVLEKRGLGLLLLVLSKKRVLLGLLIEEGISAVLLEERSGLLLIGVVLVEEAVGLLGALGRLRVFVEEGILALTEASLLVLPSEEGVLLLTEVWRLLLALTVGLFILEKAVLL